MRIVVIGTSAGGMEAVIRLLDPLPSDFPAPIFLVQHMAADAVGEVLVRTLANRSQLDCKVARHGEKFQAGHVYVAPPNHHTLIGAGEIIISKGARENRSRPAIDPLFRSAAVAYGSKVIGVLLTGYLDDGTSGLLAIQKCGGICVVQTPCDAAYPDMPQNALNNLEPDYNLPVDKIGAVLREIVRRPIPKSSPIPADVALEAAIAERVVSDVKAVEKLGKQVPFNCPDCGGVLWEMKKGKTLRYRCHTGHAFTSAVLLAEQTKAIEETLWVALRMFEERKNLLNIMADPAGRDFNKSADERAKESNIHIERIRAILLAGPEPTPNSKSKPRRKSLPGGNDTDAGRKALVTRASSRELL